jgi:integrase
VEDKLLDFYAHHRDWTRGRMSVMKCAVSLFGEANDREYTFRRLRRALPAGNRKPRDRAPSIEEGREMLKRSDLREKALLLTAASSGLRREALCNLKLGDLTPLPSGIVRVLAYQGEPEEYTSFLTPEAWQAIGDYLEGRSEPDSPLFQNCFSERMSGKAVEMVMRRLAQRAGVKGFKPVHGWRKFFKTRCEQGTKTLFAETLLGHRTGLQENYFRPTETELASEYLKCVEFLTFSPEYHLKRELTDEKGRNDDLTKKVLTIESELIMIRSWIAQLPAYAVTQPLAQPLPQGAHQADSGATP